VFFVDGIGDSYFANANIEVKVFSKKSHTQDLIPPARMMLIYPSGYLSAIIWGANIAGVYQIVKT
jgi:hypothetical protein